MRDTGAACTLRSCVGDDGGRGDDDAGDDDDAVLVPLDCDCVLGASDAGRVALSALRESGRGGGGRASSGACCGAKKWARSP